MLSNASNATLVLPHDKIECCAHFSASKKHTAGGRMLLDRWPLLRRFSFSLQRGRCARTCVTEEAGRHGFSAASLDGSWIGVRRGSAQQDLCGRVGVGWSSRSIGGVWFCCRAAVLSLKGAKSRPRGKLHMSQRQRNKQEWKVLPGAGAVGQPCEKLFKDQQMNGTLQRSIYMAAANDCWR